MEYFKPPWCRYLWVNKKEYEALTRMREASLAKKNAAKRAHLRLVSPLRKPLTHGDG
ncbi:hypothetical protein SCFA_190006 [anaerobic digester metagenome]|jgi:hypothetical protein|uniref:Uncharacterized protein n=1 Tax=anaerobic digester metagenome TaxID=1263854 RepID=A0A485LXM3_9ZZZZ